MNSYDFDIAIIGGGCIGSSVLHELSQRGFKNISLIDQGRKSLSATANSGGMLRVFHENIEHINLALANQAQIKAHCQSGVFSEKGEANGSLYFFNKARYQNYQNNLQMMAQANYPFEVLSQTSGAKRFPHYQWNLDECAIYEPLGSHLNTQQFVSDLLTASIAKGATLFDDFEVRRICPYQNRFRISSDLGTVTARTLILAGGARILPRLHDLGVQIPLTKKNLKTYLAKKMQSDFLMPNFFDRETLDFGRFGHGEDIVLSNPSTTRVLQNLGQELGHKIWGEIFVESSAEDCYSPNRLGFSGQVPGYPGLILATGWGGTAFKFALEVGRRVANEVERSLPNAIQTRTITYA